MLDRVLIGRRKFVVFQMLAGLALEESRKSSNAKNAEGFARLAIAIDRRAQQIIADESEAESIEDFANECFEKLRTDVPHVWRPLAAELIADMSAFFDRWFRRAPPDPLVDVMLLLEKKIAQFYPQFEVDILRRVLSVQEVGSVHPAEQAPHIYSSDIEITGYTKRRPGLLEVGIRITGASLKFEEFSAMPFVMMHELFVHAGAHPSATQMAGDFAEGWMDTAAFCQYQYIIENLGADVPEFSYLAHPESVSKYSLSAYEDRYGPYSPARLGQTCARRLQDACSAVDGTDGLQTATGLAADLNRSPLSADDRAELTEIIGTADASDVDLASSISTYLENGTGVERAVEFAQSLLP